MPTDEFLLFLSPSQQVNNLGVNEYGNERANMYELTNLVRNKILTYTDRITVHMGTMGSSLADLVYQSNQTVYRPSKQNNSLHLEIHSNALSGEPQYVAHGTEAFWHYRTPNNSISPKVAQALVDSLGSIYGSRSARPDNVLYSSGLYMLKNALAPSVLVECFFHDNPNDVAKWKASKDLTAQKIVEAIFKVWDIQMPTTTVTPSGEMDYKSIIDYCSNYELSWFKFLDRLKLDPNYPEAKNLPTLIERIWNHIKA